MALLKGHWEWHFTAYMTSWAGVDNFHKGLENRCLISMTALLWLKEIQQLHADANLKWFGFQCLNLFPQLKNLYKLAGLSSMREGIAWKRLGRRPSCLASSPNHQLWILSFAYRGNNIRLINEAFRVWLRGMQDRITHILGKDKLGL